MFIELAGARRQALLPLLQLELLRLQCPALPRNLLLLLEQFFAAGFELLVLLPEFLQIGLLLMAGLELAGLPLLFALGQFLLEPRQMRRFVLELLGAATQFVVTPRRLRTILRQLRRQKLHLVGEGCFDAANAVPFGLQQLPRPLPVLIQVASELVAPNFAADGFAKLFFQRAHMPNLRSVGSNPTCRSGVSALIVQAHGNPRIARKYLLVLYVRSCAWSKEASTIADVLKRH